MKSDDGFLGAIAGLLSIEVLQGWAGVVAGFATGFYMVVKAYYLIKNKGK